MISHLKKVFSNSTLGSKVNDDGGYGLIILILSLGLFLELKRNVGDELVMVVVANKLDLESRREVTLEQAREYVTRALGPDTLLYEASAKDDDGR